MSAHQPNIPPHCPLAEEELHYLRKHMKDGNVIDIAGSKVRTSFMVFLSIIATAASMGGIWFVLQKRVDDNAMQLANLVSAPETIRRLAAENERQEKAIAEVSRQTSGVNELLIRIDERTNQTAKDVAELKARK